jgi:hypothetical protein
LPRPPEHGGRGGVVAKLIRVWRHNVAGAHGVLPQEVPSARQPESPLPLDPISGPDPAAIPGPDASADPAAKTMSAGQQVRLRPSGRHGRHARGSAARPSRRPSLSIRSAEGRQWSADLSGPGPAGLVVYGLGGIGKSTLAAQIASRVSRLRSGHVVTTLSGELPAACLPAGPTETDFIILDNFDDNLAQHAGQWTVRDPALAALLATWPGKLLITCRRPFTLVPAAAADPTAMASHAAVPTRSRRARLVFRQLGPLTRSGAWELTSSLPAIRLLRDSERDLLWRLTAGHPLAMEQLDSLLAMGARYTEVAGRIESMIEARNGQPLPRTEPTEWPEATATLIASAAGDQLVGELLARLSAGARTLLVRASVFRVPVAPDVLAARPGQITEAQSAGLLAAGPGADLSVHRWTSNALHRCLAEADLGAQLVAAHRQAAGYWRTLAATDPATPPGHRAELEAGYHDRQATEASPAERAVRLDIGRSAGGGRRRLNRLIRIGVPGAVAAVAAVLAVEATQGFGVPHVASSARPAVTSAAALVTQAASVRAQAAAWAARQVSSGAIVACDPAMCSVLVRHGIAVGNLLALGPGAPDPLGSAVVLASAAVRGMFGDRLASVYAPDVLASFGSGQDRIDVRAVAPDGAAAYLTALAADLRARRVAGDQLLRDPQITFSPSARAQLAAGQVDARLLITLDTLAASEPVRIGAFLDDGPGASPGLPLRAAELTAVRGAARNTLAFFRAQRPPYLPARAAVTAQGSGGSVLTVQFAAPVPLGLLQPQS